MPDINPAKPSKPSKKARPSKAAVPDTTKEPFSWIDEDTKHSRFANFINVTSDVCHGVYTNLRLIETAQSYDMPAPDLEDVAAQLPVVNVEQTNALQKLSMASTWLLREFTETQIRPAHVQDGERMQTLKVLDQAMHRRPTEPGL